MSHLRNLDDIKQDLLRLLETRFTRADYLRLNKFWKAIKIQSVVDEILSDIQADRELAKQQYVQTFNDNVVYVIVGRGFGSMNLIKKEYRYIAANIDQINKLLEDYNSENDGYIYSLKAIEQIDKPRHIDYRIFNG